ncbi:MAG: hypothetical protein KatS3mg060_3665 [Dehalococcoidia bacterium]|nr:MAG: hypothetical protein KatS3mg060_3665 [Dehalococcoidia bacterium]
MSSAQMTTLAVVLRRQRDGGAGGYRPRDRPDRLIVLPSSPEGRIAGVQTDVASVLVGGRPRGLKTNRGRRIRR